MNIDYNRGVYKRIHTSGVEVYMYADEPGVFRNSFGTEVGEAMAREAGFDVEGLAVQRRKKERLVQAAEIIEQEFSGGVEREVVQERGGFKIMSLGMGRHIVVDPDDGNLTPAPMPLEAAKVLFEQIAPAGEPEGEPKDEAKDSEYEKELAAKAKAKSKETPAKE